MPQTATPKIRPATVAAQDHELFVDFQESQIPWLSTIGSSGQWGTESIRKTRPGTADKTRAWIEKSERQSPLGDDWCRAFIAEGSDGTPLAGLVLESKAADYTRSLLSEHDESEPFIYLTYLLSNRNAGEERKGAGAALIAFAIEQTKAVRLKRICVDCYRGNDRKLVKYYESQGFLPLGDFTAGEKEWPGCLLEMRL